MPETIAYIGIGSNMGKSEDIVASAIKDLQNHPEITGVKSSSYYLTDPVGGVEQDQFINAVIKIDTSLDAHELLNFLHELEIKYKRVRTVRWGPRTLDLDIELFGDEIIHDSELDVPHAEMFNRLFVLIPLLEIIDADNPYKKRIQAAADKLNGQQYIVKIAKEA
ncbi:2-amino-4-hydroxy-6-hydroxymethyldihydropteridine diphosphokinase [Companilactobacillus ginsenosidimutans]|uniref:2-amino-4-hydroxy-6-hydroxymethyldihydropteridine diphosphokinase n=1 Tax=Companilactobacillus ginsenosidimutans TaxID=1007676 RepID=A0A0H4QGJ7_9LACO|nr:2-amino-4-hydroxy-6-hydroxymethyldihydropteridine diphosphokinase [Companilactobacillus ginsenosidimutans]AKP67529.1 2-amino-4-hydroxy-6-hydroxymethyldihydropteridine pyrophosphokinase [Companilactobacillus ginsenosidimutans]